MHQTKHPTTMPPCRWGAVRQCRLAVVSALVTGMVLVPAVSVAAATPTSTSIVSHPTAHEYSNMRQPSTTLRNPANQSSTKHPSHKPKPTPTPTPTPSNPLAPHAPVGLYVASSPELAPQSCQSMTTPLARSTHPVFGVSSGAPAYNADRPNLRATFEVSRSSGEPLLTQSVTFVGSSARFQVPDGVLTDGAYRVRARAEDGAAVSEWLPWCAFTVDTSNAVPTPSVPDTLRISTGPYSGFQQCGAESGDPAVRTGNSLSFAANPTPSIIGVTYPNLSATFEIGHPGQEPLIRKTEPVWPSGLVFGAGLAPGTLTPGSYQFRVRAEDGNAVSAWSSWCAFTVTE
ncbi:hypothetical protein [Actinomadura alba]|uniref:Uncharacterized protein n=1 Tax=Actinomadura alba TaxID=406431 RepID=A0ABR7LW19_9ACTN|nr:hypothetical protein [Actinomadura alba]MBC6468670.1 hypothetical protein [Actinomadura alba]